MGVGLGGIGAGVGSLQKDVLLLVGHAGSVIPLQHFHNVLLGYLLFR
tara:strand:- start:5099 stop:5239 length:141 start_codon:yes stop_codon:yes gene_type:complete